MFTLIGGPAAGRVTNTTEPALKEQGAVYTRMTLGVNRPGVNRKTLVYVAHSMNAEEALLELLRGYSDDANRRAKAERERTGG